ncbi:MAG: GntR family transcriptional regulator [Candidatus Bipolaricaulota bacterium]
MKRPPTMVEIASKHIERAIFAGELSMGEPLKEARLMEEMNVSRGTIRQAFIVLQDLGLVDVVPHRGAFVAALSCNDVIETYTVRSLIEPYAALVAFHEGSLDAALAEHLNGVLDQMSQAEKDNDLEGITRGDVDFHYSLLEAAKHGILRNIFRNLLSRTRLCMFQNILLSGMPISPNPHEHYEIVYAIEEREPDRLVRLLGEHSIRALDHFLSHQPDVEAEDIAYRTRFVEQIPWLNMLDGAAASSAGSSASVGSGGEKEE